LDLQIGKKRNPAIPVRRWGREKKVGVGNALKLANKAITVKPKKGGGGRNRSS